jgi:hypothetical protein
MRTHTALAALFLLTAAVFQVPAQAQTDARSKLELRVVDETNTALASATVTIFTLDGNPAMTANTDEKGIAVFESLPRGMAQIYARRAGYSPFIEKTTLKGGENRQDATLRMERSEGEDAAESTSGS